MPSPLVSTAELAARLDDARTVIVDVRHDLAQREWGAQQHALAHLPGARFAHIDRDLAAAPTGRNGRHPLPAPDDAARLFGALGIGPDSEVVAYDQGTGMYASRVWWMLRWLGHDAVAVLDGGLRRWQALGLPLSRDVPAARPRQFAPRLRGAGAVDAGTVQAAARDGAQRVVDARAAERYRGEVEPIDRVAGHVPGARNHPSSSLLGADGRFLPPDELRRTLLATLDGVPPERTAVYCGSGVTACHVLLALEHAGLPGARLYPGSWSEWSRDPARPVATGAAP